MKLDRALDKRRIEHVGAEDRALLRSNPSAAADAGMRAWRWSWRWSSDLAMPSKRACHPGRKAINLRDWGGAPAPRNPRNTLTGVPYGNICGVGAARVLTQAFASLQPGLRSCAASRLKGSLRAGKALVDSIGPNGHQLRFGNHFETICLPLQ